MIVVVRMICLLVACGCMTGTALAQKYPIKTVRIIVPQLPGDSCDTLARLIGHRMGERLGQQFVADNRPGASGTIGLALVVHPSTPFKNVGQFIKYLKANPGKVAFASNGEGAFLHMATEMFRSAVGIEYLHVPFKGVPQMGAELMSGRVDAGFSSFTGMYPFIVSGRVRLLGIAKEKRAPNYPDFPTIAETVPGFSSGGWFGFVAPANVPKDIIAILNREVNAALKQPDIQKKLEALGLDLWAESPEYFGALLKSEYDKYGKVARDIGLVPK